MVVTAQVRAIVWAQWRSMRNFRAGGSKAAGWFASIVAVAWYGMWLLGAVAVALICSERAGYEVSLTGFLRTTLFVVTLYWQAVPILMASTGLSLDLRRLIVYPVPHSDLFRIEVLLRLSTAGEMVLISGGVFVGLLWNPRLPWWTVLWLIPFLFFNLFLATALRDLLGRLFARRGVREVLVLGIVLLAASVQLVLTTVLREGGGPKIGIDLGDFWPWSATAALCTGQVHAGAAAALAAWLGAAYLFGRRQFERSLRFDAATSGSSGDARARASYLDWFYRLPLLIFRDPIGAMVEKELRSLARSPRFRLVFLMGFSFGLLIWLPLVFRDTDKPLLGDHFLTVIAVYALMLLGEVSFWNTFGFDRRAVQVYFALPVPFSSVLLAKNAASLLFVVLEVSLITAVCAILRLPLTPAAVLEAFCVTAVMALFLLSIGNILSTRSPKPVDADQTWRRTAAGKVQAVLLVIYLIVAAPISLAYLAAYAFESTQAFYAVLAFDAIIAGIIYYIAMDTAVRTATERKEQIIATLSHVEGPVG